MSKPRPTVRAPERRPLRIDCSEHTLRNLMTEQSRISDGFATFYLGVREDFIAAGFPEHVLPNPKGRRTSLQIEPGGRCYQDVVDAWLTPVEGGLELEIHWDMHGPGGCGHPALVEISRLLACSLSAWSSPRNHTTNEVPTERLVTLNTEGAGDYSMAPHKRFQYTAAFRRQLLDLHNTVYRTLQLGEILPLESEDRARASTLAPVSSIDAERLTRTAIDNAKRGTR